jgi:hypothetical protein
VDNLIWKRSPSPVSLWPQKLMQVQIALVYLSTVIFKLLDPCWTRGYAVYFSLHYISDLKNFWIPELLRNPPFTNFLTYSTLLTEIALGILPFFKKYRVPVLLAGIGLHLGISYSMFIPLFGPTCVAAYLAFFSGEEITGFLEGMKRLGERVPSKSPI